MYEITSYYYLNNNQKDTILYLHGWGCNKQYMMPLISNVKRWNVLVIDLPGFGTNPPFTSYKTFDDFIDIIDKFIKDNNYQITYIIGHSFGGKLAVSLTKRLNIRHLFLFAPSIFNKPRLLSYYIKVYLYKLIKRIKPNSKLLKYFGSKDYKSLNNIMKATMSNVINYDLSKLIKEINTPTTLFFANKDKITPIYLGKKIKRKMKDCNLFVINGNHFAYLNNINYINRIIESVVILNA